MTDDMTDEDEQELREHVGSAMDEAETPGLIVAQREPYPVVLRAILSDEFNDPDVLPRTFAQAVTHAHAECDALGLRPELYTPILVVVPEPLVSVWMDSLVTLLESYRLEHDGGA